MTVCNSFSKRLKQKENQGKEDIYQYDTLPPVFRGQVIHVLLDTLGQWHGGGYGQENQPSPYHRSDSWWNLIYDVIRKEKGQQALTSRYRDPPIAQVCDYISTADTVSALDAIELAFRVIDGPVREVPSRDRDAYQLQQEPGDAIHELNTRFREHGIGYQYESGELIRLDSTFIHSEVTKPTLQLLAKAGEQFQGPLDEFLNAHTK